MKNKNKKKKKKIKKEDMSFAQIGADSKYSRAMQNSKKGNTKDDKLEDENDFARSMDDTDDSDIELKLSDIYADVFDELEDEGENK
jgi:hypothetical protein